MKSLEMYVEQKNRLHKFFMIAPYSLSNAADRQSIADHLVADMSPENISCDGEIRGTALRAKAECLNLCVKELCSIDSTVKFQSY